MAPGPHPPGRSLGCSPCPLSLCHQAQPLNTVWPMAGPRLLWRGHCHPCFSVNCRSEQVGFCRQGEDEGAVSQVSVPVCSSLLSALLSPSSSFIPAEGTDFETSVSPSFISLCRPRPLLWCSSDVEEPAGSLRQVQFSTANIHPASPARLRARPGDMVVTQPRAVSGWSSLTVGHRPENQGQYWTVCSREGSSGHLRVTVACY